jgi:hypothetical protein
LIKGLGTSDKKDAREYFSKLEMHKKSFGVPVPGDRQLIEMAFSKKKAAERKDWLAQYEVHTYHRNPNVINNTQPSMLLAAWYIYGPQRQGD